MDKNDLKALLVNILIVPIAAGLAIVISWPYYNNVGNSGLPVYALAVILAFVINWIAFIPSFIYKSEKYYDLVGSITYTSVIVSSFIISGNYGPRNMIILIITLIWTFRLGVFLFRRILKAGEDKRFREIKQSFWRFLRAWTIQGLWVSFTIAAALASISADSEAILEYNTYDFIMMIIGLLVWIVGFTFEAVADRQKKKFINNLDNQGKFINVGLWSISRHPNYFGEITIWVGMVLIALPTLQGWRFFALISPIFVFLLITQVSGVPLLEDYADKKWDGQADYEEYKKNTPVLFPKIPRRNKK
ncbi:MAG: DUF1295 domain-containing protein [Promethearchaeota archaeon]